MELSMHIKQYLALSPQLLQSMQVLRMSGAELSEYIENCALENPMLETELPSAPREAHAVAEIGLQIRSRERGKPREALRADTPEQKEDTLYDHLMSQLRMSDVDRDTAVLCAYLIGSLDEKGFLDESIQTIAAELDREYRDVVRALELLQSFDPAGVGAQDLEECLLLQLRRLPDTRLAQVIVRKHWKSLTLDRFESVARAEQTSVESVCAAFARIRELTPHPGMAFSTEEKPEYVFPEFAVKVEGGRLTMTELQGAYPRISISSYYEQLMRDSSDPEVIAYLQKKLMQAAEIVHNIEQRKTTLRSCVEEIIQLQQAFFSRGDALLPMTQEQIAAKLGIHKSTVSRAIREKYIQCEHGTYLLSSLFSRGVRGADNVTSPDAVKRQILQLVRAEDEHHPLSDQKIANALGCRGISISRRTVAKYRDELHILSSTYRKRKNEH